MKRKPMEKDWAWNMLKNKSGWVMSDVSIFVEKIEELEKRIAELEKNRLTEATNCQYTSTAA